MADPQITPEMLEELRRRRAAEPRATPEEKAAAVRFLVLRLPLATATFLLFVGTVFSCASYASKHPHHLIILIPAALFGVACLVASVLLMVYRRHPKRR